MKWLLFPVAIGLVLTLPAGVEGKLKVVTTLAELGWIAERVGGEDVEVEALCPGPQDPHYLPAKPSLARKLSKADLLVYNGLELEIGWLPLLIEAARNPRVRPGSRGELDCAQALTEILEVPTGPVDRAQGDIHPLGNPHYLLDPRNGVAVGRLIAARMAELDPAAADRYRERADGLAAEVAGRLPAWKEAVAPVLVCPVIVYHQHWEYLLAWLDLRRLGAIEHRPGISPSPRHVKQLIELGKAQPCVVVVAATWDHRDAARNAAHRMHAPLVILPGAVEALAEAGGYLQMFDVICSRLRTAVRPGGAEGGNSE